MQIIAQVPNWVEDGGGWFALVGGFLAMVCSVIVIAKWTRTVFVQEVREIVALEAAPIKAEMIQVREDLVDHMRVEEAQAEKLNQWRAGVDLALRNIQQAQVSEIHRVEG